MNKLLISYSMMAFSVLTHANEPVSIIVNKNQTFFVVNLPANPTTGYQWSVVQFDKVLLTLSSSVYQKPNNYLIGAGGHMLYTFTLNKRKIYPDSTTLVFKYARSWEKHDIGSTQKVTVHFVETKEKLGKGK